MKPIRDENILNRRYKVVEFFTNNRNHEFVSELIKTLKKCKFINQILKRMRIAKCNLNEWKRLYNTTHAFFKIAKLSVLINERITNNKYPTNINTDSNLKNCKFETFRNHLLNNFQYSKSKLFQRTSLLNSDSESRTKKNINSETPCLTNTENISSLRGSSYAISNNAIDDKDNDTIFSYIINQDFAAKFECLINLFDRIINLKESNEMKRCKINTNISAELDEKKQIYSKLPEYLTRIARQELEKANLTECHVIYIPLHGFLLLLKLESIINETNKTDLKRISIFNKCETQQQVSNGEINDEEFMDSQDISNDNKNDENNNETNEFDNLRAQFEFLNKLEFSFKSNDQYYYKNERMRELDAEFGDLFSQINDMESEILEKLQSEFIK